MLLFFLNDLFSYFWLHWVFLAACRLSLVAENRSYCLVEVHCGGLCCGEWALGQGLSCSMDGMWVFPDYGKHKDNMLFLI